MSYEKYTYWILDLYISDINFIMDLCRSTHGTEIQHYAFVNTLHNALGWVGIINVIQPPEVRYGGTSQNAIRRGKY